MSHYRMQRRAPQKQKLFTRPQANVPGKKVKLEAAKCAYCAARSISRCERPDCNLPICDKHRTRKAGGSLCPNHKNNSLLIQFDGFPTGRFGDRGEAYAQKINPRTLTQPKPSV